MDKRQLQKMEYMRECEIRRKYAPVLLNKNYASLKLVEIITKEFLDARNA